MTENQSPQSACEPSDAAWKRAGEVAARILENLADRDARAEAAAQRTVSTAA